MGSYSAECKMERCKSMCGIAGLIDTNHSRDDSGKHINSMCVISGYRGPDDHGSLLGDRMALAMRHHSILDLSGSHQPVFNEDGTALVDFNGAIKYLLKKVVADLLPSEILARPKKGDSVPIRGRIRGDLVTYANDLLNPPRARQPERE